MAIIRFKARPALTICDIFIFPEEKTMAFGGVATGNMNAIEAEMVAGTIIKRGLKPRANAVPFIIGSNAAVVAVLEVSSVKKVKSKQIIKTISNG